MSSGFERAQTKRPQDTKEARAMALLLNREVVGLPVVLRYKSCPRHMHGHPLTYSNTTINEISYVSRFSE
jgi:hypothetical protein